MALILTLVNVSNLADVSDYRYAVLVGDGTPERSTPLAHGTIVGHRRAEGWQVLVRKLLEAEPDAAFIDHRTRLLPAATQPVPRPDTPPLMCGPGSDF